MTAFAKGAAIQAASMPRKKFSLPELGKDTYIWIRALTAKEAKTHLVADQGQEEKSATGYKLISLCAVNEDGSQIFDSEKDVEENFDVSMASVFAIVDLICELSGVPKGKDRSKN